MKNLKSEFEHRVLGSSILSCPCCGNEILSTPGFICEVCLWEVDGNRDENEYSPANGMSLKQYKAEYFGN